MALPEYTLPAWEEPWELARPGKADQHDDYREEHPELYSVTAPPVVPVRPLAEYEPSQAVMMRPSGSIGSFHRGIIEGLAGRVDRLVVFHTPGQAEDMKDEILDLGVDEAALEMLNVEKTDSIWTRDYGPISHVTQDGSIGFVDFRYYKNRMYDDAIPTKLANAWGTNVFRVSMSYEGGNFMADPHGTCYMTEKIYKQNAGHDKEQIDSWMAQYLGCSQMVVAPWPKGLGTGHIDMFAKLMNDGTVLLGNYADGVQSENGKMLNDFADKLASVVTESGKSLKIIRLPLPWDETGVWYTYTNSLIVNDVVLVPVFSSFEDMEDEAIAAYENARPDLDIVTVNADGIIPSGGAMHCVTMTVPDGPVEKYQDDPPQLCKYNEISKCEGLSPCGGLPFEGECDGDLLSYCGADGYPHAQSCPECCAFNPAPDKVWYECTNGPLCTSCADECAAGETGCSALFSHTWACGKTDADPCLERAYAPCAAGLACNPESGTCEPQSAPDPAPESSPEIDSDVRSGCDAACSFQGSRVCASEDSVAVCLADDAGCLTLSAPIPCEPGMVCFDGACSRFPPELAPDAPGSDLGPGADSWPDYISDYDEAEASGAGCSCSVGLSSMKTPSPLGLLLYLIILVLKREGRRTQVCGS